MTPQYCIVSIVLSAVWQPGTSSLHTFMISQEWPFLTPPPPPAHSLGGATPWAHLSSLQRALGLPFHPPGPAYSAHSSFRMADFIILQRDSYKKKKNAEGW